ncbi:MarR family winged helix-turn-helix transcriptional regulator [Streptomyces sp. NPDC060030]|uniref:MarR family winged helix-turn-helix transcriptional regulator n=1 Tax=Streptomyces sp. NPDC060030 TaxID=3347042 RepID=UPI0036A9FA84
MEHALRPLHLTQAQYTALARLANDGPVSGAELARRCGVTAQSVGVAIHGLAERGMVERRAHPSNGRIIEISITAAGRALALQGEQALLPIEDQALALFTPAERQRLRNDLRRVLSVLHPPALPQDG